VLRVSVKDNPTGSFLVEWYQPGLASAPPAETAARLAAGAAVARANGSAVSVLLTLSAPRDDTLFGVLCADTEETVRALAERIGLDWHPTLTRQTFNGRSIRPNTSFTGGRKSVLSDEDVARIGDGPMMAAYRTLRL